MSYEPETVTRPTQPFLDNHFDCRELAPQRGNHRSEEGHPYSPGLRFLSFEQAAEDAAQILLAG